LCVLNRQPTWTKITQTVHGKGQRAESKDQRADMSTDVLFVLTDTYGHTRTATDDLCVLTDTHGHTRTAKDVLSTDVMCVLTDTHERPVCADGHPQTSCVHGRPVCADGHTRTATDVLCVLTDTHGRPVCADGHPRRPRGLKSPEQSTGRASMLSPKTSVLICVLMDSHERLVCADGNTQTHTDSHGHVLCLLMDSHRQPHTSCVCWRTPMDVLPCGLTSPDQSTERASMLSP
ncbi:unnamed protein product, partial [Brassica rapa]